MDGWKGRMDGWMGGWIKRGRDREGGRQRCWFLPPPSFPKKKQEKEKEKTKKEKKKTERKGRRKKEKEEQTRNCTQRVQEQRYPFEILYQYIHDLFLKRRSIDQIESNRIE